MFRSTSWLGKLKMDPDCCWKLFYREQQKNDRELQTFQLSNTVNGLLSMGLFLAVYYFCSCIFLSSCNMACPLTEKKKTWHDHETPAKMIATFHIKLVGIEITSLMVNKLTRAPFNSKEICVIYINMSFTNPNLVWAD